MEVRILTPQEYPRLTGMAQEFYVEGNLPGRMEPARFLASWNNLHDMGAGVILGLVEGDQIYGALGAMKYPDLYDGDIVATEMFWFVNQKHRGRGILLFIKFEEWAIENQAKRIAMIHLTNLSPDTLRKLYEQHGYREIETHYIRNL